MFGYAGKVLKIDLSQKKISIHALEENLIQQFVGGVGFGTAFVYFNSSKEIDPYDSENPLVISTGPLSGTAVPTASRVEITSKSPLTGLIACSSGGGSWGHSLKLSGYDLLFITGSLDRPGIIWIDGDKVEILDGSDLEGLDTWETCALIKKRFEKHPFDDVDVMAIGPAGENLVRYASVTIDYYNSVSRCGIGGVFGSKRLKAIAIRGSKSVTVAEPDRLVFKIKSFLQQKSLWSRYDSDHLKTRSLKFTDRFANSLDLPGYYFQKPMVPNWEKRGTSVARNYIREYGSACLACPLDSGVADIDDKEQAKFSLKDIHNSIVLAWGGICGIERLEDIWKIQCLCEKLGIDCIEAAGTIGLFLYLRERGLLPKTYRGLSSLHWGNYEGIYRLLLLIARNSGVGKIFSEGSKGLSNYFSIEVEDHAATINNMTIYPIDPRSEHARAWMLGHLTSMRGGDNVRSTHLNFESVPAPLKGKISYHEYLDELGLDEKIVLRLSSKDLPPSSYENKEFLMKWEEEFITLHNMLGTCILSGISSGDLVEFYQLVTGRDISMRSLFMAAERVINLQRLYNINKSKKTQEFDWPRRFYERRAATGKLQRLCLDREQVRNTLRRYCLLRGWDTDTFTPRKETMKTLGLDKMNKEELIH